MYIITWLEFFINNRNMDLIQRKVVFFSVIAIPPSIDMRLGGIIDFTDHFGAMIVISAFLCPSVGFESLPLFKSVVMQWSKNQPSAWNTNCNSNSFTFFRWCGTDSSAALAYGALSASKSLDVP